MTLRGDVGVRRGAGRGAAGPQVHALYWLARVTLVNRQHDLAVFDAVFEAVFGDAVLPVDPARAAGTDTGPTTPRTCSRPMEGGPSGGDLSAATCPGTPCPGSRPTEEDGADERALPELLPSAVARIADTPLDELDEAELAVLGRWLEESAPRWPTRRSRRQRVRPAGHRVALRETIAASRRTGWEPMELQRYHPVRRPLTVTLLCDVSQSMQSYATVYLHLMRAFARTRRAETFAFSTSLTRLTPALSHHSAATAVALAGEQVTDRFGGTHLASCLRELLVSRHGNAVRGGVLVIASDGWDSDDPAELAAVMARAPAPGPADRLAQPAGGCAVATSRWSARWRRPCRTATPSSRPTPCGRCRRSSTPSPAPTPLTRLAPEGDVHGRLEPADVHAGAAHHRLGRPRRGDEAQQLAPPAAVWSCFGSAIADHRPVRLEAGAVEGHQPPRGQVAGDREAHGEARARRCAWPPRAPRPRSGRCAAAARAPRAVAAVPAPRPRRRPPRGPGTRSGDAAGRRVPAPPASGWPARTTASTSYRQELELHEPVGWRARRGPDRHVDGAGRRAAPGTARPGCTLSSTSRSAARLGEEVDQSGRGVLGEQARRRHPEHPPTVAGLADLADGAVLEAEDLDRAAGQPQPARGERQPGRGAGEEHVVELLAQLGDVHRDRRLADAELLGGRLHRAQPHHAREGAELGRGHPPT